jgi:hypothetical protein
MSVEMLFWLKDVASKREMSSYMFLILLYINRSNLYWIRAKQIPKKLIPKTKICDKLNPEISSEKNPKISIEIMLA